MPDINNIPESTRSVPTSPPPTPTSTSENRASPVKDLSQKALAPKEESTPPSLTDKKVTIAQEKSPVTEATKQVLTQKATNPTKLTAEKAKAVFKTHAAQFEETARKGGKSLKVAGHTFKLVQGGWVGKIKFIGEGKFKKVYKARDVATGDIVVFAKSKSILTPEQLQAKKSELKAFEEKHSGIPSQVQKLTYTTPKEVKERFAALQKEKEGLEEKYGILGKLSPDAPTEKQQKYLDLTKEKQELEEQSQEGVERYEEVIAERKELTEEYGIVSAKKLYYTAPADKQERHAAILAEIKEIKENYKVTTDEVAYSQLAKEVDKAEREIADQIREADILLLFKDVPRGVIKARAFESYADNRTALILNYEKGGELRQIIDESSVGQRKQFSDSIDSASLDLLHGLASIHKAGVIHDDLKPENILGRIVNGKLELRIADFGLSTVGKQASSLYGTPNYFSLAKWLGEHGTAADDVYALGQILTEFTTVQRSALEAYIGTLESLEDIDTETIKELADDRVEDPDSFFHIDPHLPEEKIVKTALANVQLERETLQEIKELESKVNALASEIKRLSKEGKTDEADQLFEESMNLEEEIKSKRDELQLFDGKTGEFKGFKALTNHVIWTMLDPDPKTRPTAEQALAAFEKAVKLQEKINAEVLKPS